MRAFVLPWNPVVLVFAAASGCFTPDADAPVELDGTSSAGTEVTAATNGAQSMTSAGTSPSGTATSAGTDEAPEGSDDTSDTDTTWMPTGTDESSSGSESDSGSDTTTTLCGNGIVDDGEECDDGNDEDRDACSNACVAGFHTGSLELCGEYGVAVCGYFEGECRVDPNGGALCYWPDASSLDACDGTPGIWTEPDSPFAQDSGFDYPLAGACITRVGNLRCVMADAQTCTQAGADLCFREVAPSGAQTDESSLCWWDVDEGGCARTPGIWTTAASGFGQGHPNALPPSDASACLLQVNAL